MPSPGSTTSYLVDPQIGNSDYAQFSSLLRWATNDNVRYVARPPKKRRHRRRDRNVTARRGGTQPSRRGRTQPPTFRLQPRTSSTCKVCNLGFKWWQWEQRCLGGCATIVHW